MHRLLKRIAEAKSCYTQMVEAADVFAGNNRSDSFQIQIQVQHAGAGMARCQAELPQSRVESKETSGWPQS